MISLVNYPQFTPKLPYLDPFSFDFKNLSKRVKYVSHISIKMRIHVPCYDILRQTHESFNIFLTKWLILRKYFSNSLNILLNLIFNLNLFFDIY